MTMLTACSSVDSETYQRGEFILEFIQIDDDGHVVRAELHPSAEDKGVMENVLSRLEKQKLTDDNEFVVNTGILNEAGDTILWDDGDTVAVRVEPDLFVFSPNSDAPFQAYDSNFAKQVRADRGLPE